ncbi:MAG: hypothetical protein QF464_14260 [Myxococcota bacterium]|nr:hypothetical protein [Myxococcota bacterium]
MRALAAATLLLLTGCGDTTSTSPAADASGGEADVSVAADVAVAADVTLIADVDAEPVAPLVYAPCSEAERVGGFRITLADDYTGVDGHVLDGIVPANVPDEVQVDGACRLLRAVSLYCDPACVPGETCGAQGACIPYPERSSVGLVTITGLVDALSMEAKWGNNYTNPGSMAHPGYEAAADIALTAEGGDFEAFSLRGFGVEALVPSGASEVVIEAGESIDLSWTPPTVDGPVKVHLELNLNNHGSTSAWIACDVGDTGSFTVPATLLDALYAIGVSGFPSLVMSRRSVDSVTISPGCVDLVVVSEQDVSVEIDGITSCTSDQQCPPQQTCGADLACH